MDGQEKLLDYETIKAAVAGERWATEKVLAHYADYINELSTVEIRQAAHFLKAAGNVAELPAGTEIDGKRAAPSYAALRLSPAHP